MRLYFKKVAYLSPKYKIATCLHMLIAKLKVKNSHENFQIYSSSVFTDFIYWWHPYKVYKTV